MLMAAEDFRGAVMRDWPEMGPGVSHPGELVPDVIPGISDKVSPRRLITLTPGSRSSGAATTREQPVSKGCADNG